MILRLMSQVEYLILRFEPTEGTKPTYLTYPHIRSTKLYQSSN